MNFVTSSKTPVILNLRVAYNETGVSKLPRSEVKTQPDFFINTLGLEPGNRFQFNIDKWHAIQRSGLFRNLTARFLTNDEDEILMEISGEELSSVRFSPEVSVAASISRPELSGGVSNNHNIYEPYIHFITVF